MVFMCRKKSQHARSILASLLLVSATAYAENPSQITFNNFTSLALDSQLASSPGQGIAANASKPVNYSLVYWICYYSSSFNHCPIVFTDKSNGEKVATVYLNAETATLTEPPTLYGNYAKEYEVRGWETSPINEITIVAKA